MQFSQTPFLNSLRVGFEQHNSTNNNNNNNDNNNNENNNNNNILISKKNSIDHQQANLNNNINSNQVVNGESHVLNYGGRDTVSRVNAMMNQESSIINNANNPTSNNSNNDNPNMNSYNQDLQKGLSNNHTCNVNNFNNVTDYSSTSIPNSIPTLGYQNQQSNATAGFPMLESKIFSDSFTCEELLDLYTNTRINFLEAQEQLKLNGHSSPHSYKELDGIQKHLGYKSNHFYYLLLNKSRNNPDFLTKLREKATEKIEFAPPTRHTQKNTNQFNSSQLGNSTIEHTGVGTPNDVESIDPKNRETNPKDIERGLNESIQPSTHEEKSPPSNSIQPKEKQQEKANPASESDIPKTTVSKEANTAALPRDVCLYLEKVASLRGQDAAKAESERLQNHYQPLKRKEPAPGIEKEFKDFIEKVNSNKCSRLDAVKFVKAKVKQLKDVENQETVANIIAHTALAISKEVYGSRTDIRYVLTNELLSTYPEKKTSALTFLARNRKFALRVSNWLRREIKLKKDINVGYCFNFLEKLDLTTEQLRTYALFDILTDLQKNNKTWSSTAEAILKASRIKGSASVDSPKNDNAQVASNSTNASQIQSRQQIMGNSSFSRRPLPPAASSSVTTESKSRTSSIKSGSNDEHPSRPKSPLSSDVSQKNKLNNKPSENSSGASSNTFATAASKKKWSFNNYIQSSKRKVSASDESAKKCESSRVDDTMTASAKSGTPFRKSILKPRSSKSGPKKSVRFSNDLEHVREFVSEIGSIVPTDSEHKRAREMESSEAQTLKKQKTHSEMSKYGSVIKEIVFSPWKEPSYIDLKSLPGFNNREELAASRGGSIPVSQIEDRNIPTAKPTGDVVLMSPFEPDGLIVDAQELNDNSTANDDGSEITSNATRAESNSPENANEAVNPSPDVSGQEEVSRASTESSSESSASDNSKENNENKNVDKDVLALLEDDDDVLNSHYYEDDEEEENFQKSDKSHSNGPSVDTQDLNNINDALSGENLSRKGDEDEELENSKDEISHELIPKTIQTTEKSEQSLENAMETGEDSFNNISLNQSDTGSPGFGNSVSNTGDQSFTTETPVESSTTKTYESLGVQEGDAQEDEAQEGDAQKGDAQEGNSQEGNSQEGNSQEGNSQEGNSQEGDSQAGEAQEGEAQEGEAHEIENKKSISTDGSKESDEENSGNAGTESNSKENVVSGNNSEKEALYTDLDESETTYQDSADKKINKDHKFSDVAKKSSNVFLEANGDSSLNKKSNDVVTSNDLHPTADTLKPSPSFSTNVDSGSVSMESSGSEETSGTEDVSPSNIDQEATNSNPANPKEIQGPKMLLPINKDYRPMVSRHASYTYKPLEKRDSYIPSKAPTSHPSQVSQTSEEPQKPQAPQEHDESTNGAIILTIKGAAKRSSPPQSSSPPKKRPTNYVREFSPDKLDTHHYNEKRNSESPRDFHNNHLSNVNELFPTKVKPLNVTEREDDVLYPPRGSPSQSSRSIFPSRSSDSDLLSRKLSYKSGGTRLENHTIGKRSSISKPHISPYVADQQIMELRSRDTRHYVKSLSSSERKSHTELCKYFPNCSYGNTCAFIHLSDKLQRHEKYERFRF